MRYESCTLKMIMLRDRRSHIGVALLGLPFVLAVAVYAIGWKDLHFYRQANRFLRDRPVDTVFLGDSITALWTYPSPRHLFVEHPEYVNRGISGDHAALMLLRLPQDVFALHPRTVVFLAGINDLKARAVPNAFRSAMTYEVEMSIRAAAYLVRRHHERIILCSLTPVDPDRAMRTLGIGAGHLRPDQISAVNKWTEAFAARHGLTYVDYYSALSDGHDRLRGELTDDGLHPNAGGFAIMAPIVEQAIANDRTGQK